MALLIFYLFIALFFSFLCSILEAIILSISPSYIGIKIEEGSPLKNDLKKLRDNIDKPLSAILTLNTFAHTLGAAGVGAQAQLVWGKEYLSLISAILTVLILVFSEIIPKTLGANYWKELTPFALRTLRVLVTILYPFVIISQGITYVLKKNKIESIFTRSDLQKMAEIVKKEGSIRQNESEIIKNLMSFNQIQVKDIMTPRIVVFAESQDKTIKELEDSIDNIPFSRIPVYKEDIDHITGFVLKDDILQKMAENDTEKPLNSIAREIHVVFTQLPVIELFNHLMKNKAHISLIVDEYGGTEGIITIEDIIETLLGIEIVDETDNVENLQKMAREKWKQRAKRIGLISEDEETSQEEET